jgi:hypothetical protein
MTDQVQTFDVPPADDGDDQLALAELDAAGRQEDPRRENCQVNTDRGLIQTIRGELTFTQHAGPERRVMLQLTQGCANAPGSGPDEPGFIDLSAREAYLVAIELLKFVKDRSSASAAHLRSEIAKTSVLAHTVFADAADCEHFIAELKIADIPTILLDRYGQL